VLKVATTGLADAMQAGLKSAAGGTAAELKAYNKKLSQLSPAARALTQAFVGLYPALIKARNALSGKLFAGAAVEIKALAGTYLPLLTKHGEAVATSLNGAARAVAAFVRESRTVAGVKKSLGFVAVAVNNLAAGIKPLAQGLLPLVTVSASFLPQMTSGFKAVADQFAAFMVNAEKTGALKSFIQGGLDALKALFGIIQNVGGILKSVFVDANTGAGSFFTVIGTVIKQVDDFLNSAEGMKAIGAVWGILRSVGTALGDALGKVLPQLGKALVAIAPAIGPVATAMSNFLIVLSPILPIIGKLAAVIGLQLAKALPILAPMLLAVGTAIADLLTAVAPVLPIFASIASVVGKALAGALEKLVPHIGPLVKALGAGLLKVVTALAPVLPKLAEIFGKIMDAVTPLIGPIADLVVSFIDGLMPAFDKLKPSIDKLLAALGPAMITVIGQMKPSITALTGSLVDLAPTFAQITDKVIEAIPGLLTMSGIFFKYVMPAINDMAFAIVPLIRIGTPLIKMFYFIGTSAVALAKSVASFVGRVFGIIGKLQAFLADIGTALVAGFVGGLSRAWHSVTDFFSQAVNLIPDTFLKVLNFGSPSKVMRNLGIGTVASLAGGIKSQIPTIAKVMGTVAKVVSTGVTTDATVKVKAAAVVTGAVAGAGAVAPTTPPIVINVNVATGVDPAEVGRKTVLAIEAWQKRSGRRFLAPTPVPA
jgi:phage-related protein